MEREKSSATLSSSSSDDNDGDGNKELLCQPTEAKPVNESIIVLSIRDLHRVLEILRKHNIDSTDYFDLGLGLRLLHNTIKVIKSCCREDPDSCLRECLAAWLRKVDEIESEGCPPTWYTLIEALRSTKNNKAVADAIDKEKHPACVIFSHFISAEYIKSLPDGIIRLLVGEKLIFPGDTDCSTIFTSLKKSVCSDHKNLTKFASILCKSQITVTMGCAIKRDYGQKFGIVIRISSEVIGNLTEKWDNFVKALNKIKEAVDLETLKNSLRLRLLNRPDLKPQIQECGTTTDVLELIYGQCSLTNINLLAETIEDTKNEEAIRIMQEYKKSNDTFFENLSLSLCLEKHFSPPPALQCEEAVFVVDKSIESYTLKNVERILEAAVGRLSKEVHVSVITESNSFTIICSFPLTLSESLISAALKNLKILKEKGVIMLTIGYCTVYDHKEDVFYTTDEELEDYITSVYASIGTMEQLLVSTSVKLMISEEETSTLNEEMLIARKEAETMKQSLERMEANIKKGSTKENEILKQNADEMKKLLQKKIEHEPKNENSKEILHVMEKQPVFYQSEKEEQEMSAKEYEEHSPGMQEDMRENRIAEKTEKYLAVDQTGEVLMSKQIEKSEKVDVESREKSPIIFEDDVYKEVVISHPLLIAIVKTRQFNRLKDIKKLGFIYYNRPKATYSRFQQSIGMCYLAGKFVKKLKRRQPKLNITESDVICVQVAALCYNLGFGPFSYIFNDWLLHKTSPSKKHWKYDSNASAMMFQYMVDNNNLPFKVYLDDYEQDIEFIKELITGIKGPQAEQRKDKIFLYEIVVNKKSGLDVSRIDYTARDTTVILGKGIHFSWKKFFQEIWVKTCPDGERHICVKEDVLEMCNGLFADRHILFTQLLYDCKNRILATMITQIFMKCGNIKLIRAPNGKRLTLIEATESMETYARLTDGILDVIKEQVDDEEVQDLIHCIERSELFIPIGYITNYLNGPQHLKLDIIRFSEVNEEELQVDDIIVDPVKSGYEESTGQSMFYISSDGSIKKWTNEWQPIPRGAFLAPLRVFLAKRNKVLVEKVKRGLEIVAGITKPYGIYDNVTDIDLTPE